MSAKFLKEDGKEIDRRIVSKAWKIFQDVYHEASKNGETNLELSFVPSLGKVLSTVDAKIRHDMGCVFQTMLNYVRFHEGNELDKVTVSGLINDVPGGDLHIPGGYKQILDSIKRDIPESTILYNSEVVYIKWNDTDERFVRLTTRDGRIFEGNHVIVTCSLGYLKAHRDTLFDPGLPSRKYDVISSLGFGTVNKIFLEFEKPIFGQTNIGIAFAWENAYEKIDSSNWFKRLFGFDAVFTNPRVVLGWISGDGALAMEKLPDQEIVETSMKLLRQFMNNQAIPEPINFIVTRWNRNPYTLGSYSHRTPRLIKDEYEVIGEPLVNKHGVPVLFFAGEATQRAYFGCTHAARDSGIREAERIFQYSALGSKSTSSKLWCCQHRLPVVKGYTLTWSHDFTKLPCIYFNEPCHEVMTMRPAKTQISLGIRHVWSESSLSAQWV